MLLMVLFMVGIFHKGNRDRGILICNVKNKQHYSHVSMIDVPDEVFLAEAVQAGRPLSFGHINDVCFPKSMKLYSVPYYPLNASRQLHGITLQQKHDNLNGIIQQYATETH